VTNKAAQMLEKRQPNRQRNNEKMAAAQKLEIVRLPVLQDNYIWLAREPISGAVGGSIPRWPSR